MWTWGAFEGGQLGTGASEPALTPYQVNGLPAIAWIAAGVQTAVAVATTGEVYVWGQNNRYQIPNAAQDQIVPIPTLVSGIDDAVAVTAGMNHVAVLRSTGSVVSWGDNVDGAIGHGVPTPDYSDRLSPGPVLAPGNAGLIDIIGGYGHAFALTDTGTVLAWGTGQFGNARSESIRLVERTHCSSGLTDVSGDHGRSLLQCLAVKNDGSLLAWGQNPYGELGDGTTDVKDELALVTGRPAVAAVAGGGYHALAATADGTRAGLGHQRLRPARRWLHYVSTSPRSR